MNISTETKPTKEAIERKKAQIAASGINLREECEKAGINYQAAREVLCGKSAARRGNQHKAAVFLGLKKSLDKATVLNLGGLKHEVLF